MSRYWAFVSVGVGVGEYQSDSFVCFGAKPTQRVCARDLQRDQKKTREGKVPEKNRTRQSVGESGQQKSEEADGQRKETARTCGPRDRVGQRERMSLHSWWLCGNFARIHARDRPQMHRKLRQIVTKFSLLALGANQSP